MMRRIIFFSISILVSLFVFAGDARADSLACDNGTGWDKGVCVSDYRCQKDERCEESTWCGPPAYPGGPIAVPYCVNKLCKCIDPPAAPKPICTTFCPNRTDFGWQWGFPCSGCTNQSLADVCRGAVAGNKGGVLSYCAILNYCSNLNGTTCTATNSCGMTASGTYNCTTCSATPPSETLCNQTPTGTFSSADCSVATGTAQDPDTTNPIQVHIYNNGVYLATVTANQPKPAWIYPIPAALKDGVAHVLRAYAINVDSSGTLSGPNPELAVSKTITCVQPPTGALTSATCGSATGNASDPPAASVTTVIYDGQAGAGGVQIGVGNATPNFTIPFPPFTNGQTHTLYAYAQDIPTGTWYQLTGVIPVTCAPTVQLTADPTSVTYGGASTLTGVIGNATRCTANPGGLDFSPPGGSMTDSRRYGPLTATTTFNLTCYNALNVSATDTATVTVNIPPPTASITGIVDGDYCSSGASLIATWRYNQTALPISAYQVQVGNVSDGIVYDTYKRDKTSFTPPTPMTASITTTTGTLAFSTLYGVRVKVWDTSDQPSVWSSIVPYTTKAGPWAKPAFTLAPPKPAAGQPVTFTDATNYGPPGTPGGLQWDFGDGSPVDTSSPATHTYASESASVTVTLRARSSLMPVGSYCSATQSIGILKAIPGYREVLPGARTSPLDTQRK